MTQLTMIRGDRKEFALTLTDAAGAPLDLDDVTLRFTVKERTEDEDVVIYKESGAGIEVTDGDAGEATITIDAVDTDDLTTPRNYVWDLEVEGTAGDIRTPLMGTLRIRHDVTRPAGS